MPSGAEMLAIATISTIGALAQAAVTIRWYEPPARDSGETPAPILETGVFFVAFGMIFAVLGTVVSAVAGVAPPFGLALTLLLTPVGLWLAHAAYHERLGRSSDTVERYMGTVFGVVLAVYPLVLLVA